MRRSGRRAAAVTEDKIEENAVPGPGADEDAMAAAPRPCYFEELPHVLAEAIVAHSVGVLADVPTVSAVCRTWHHSIFASEELWKRLACGRFKMVAHEALQGRVPTSSWLQVAQTHQQIVHRRNKCLKHVLPTGGLRELRRHVPSTELKDYVFHVQLTYGKRLLGEWTGTFSSLEQFTGPNASTGGALPADVVQSLGVRMWTDDDAPSSKHPHLPCTQDDSVEQWDRIKLHVYASHQFTTTKLYCARMFDTHEFDIVPILHLRRRRGRSAPIMLGDEDPNDKEEMDDFCLIPQFAWSDENEEEDADAELFVWHKELRIAFDTVFFPQGGEMQDVTTREMVTVLEMRLLDTAQTVTCGRLLENKHCPSDFEDDADPSDDQAADEPLIGQEERTMDFHIAFTLSTEEDEDGESSRVELESKNVTAARSMEPVKASPAKSFTFVLDADESCTLQANELYSTVLTNGERQWYAPEETELTFDEVMRTRKKNQRRWRVEAGEYGFTYAVKLFEGDHQLSVTILEMIFGWVDDLPGSDDAQYW